MLFLGRIFHSNELFGRFTKWMLWVLNFSLSTGQVNSYLLLINIKLVSLHANQQVLSYSNITHIINNSRKLNIFFFSSILLNFSACQKIKSLLSMVQKLKIKFGHTSCQLTTYRTYCTKIAPLHVISAQFNTQCQTCKQPNCT